MAYVRDVDNKPESPQWVFALGLLYAADRAWLPVTTERLSEDVNHVILLIAGVRIWVFDDSGWDYVDRIEVSGDVHRTDDDKEPDESLLVRDFDPLEGGILQKAFDETPWVEPT